MLAVKEQRIPPGGAPVKTLTLVLSLMVITALFTLPVAAGELLRETFDDAEAGSITNLPHWTELYTAPTISTARPYSSPHALELRPVTTDRTGAIASNFLARYPTNQPTEHPVIRVSAKFFLPHTNVHLQFGLRDSQSQSFFYFVITNGLAKLRSHDTGVTLPTGAYFNVIFHLNRSNTQARLDINNTNLINWGDYTSGVNGARFNQLVIFREPHPSQDQQSVFVDDIRVDTFLPHILAWWRLDDALTPFADQLGAFHSPTQPSPGILVAPNNHPYDPLHDGANDLTNEAVIRKPISANLACARTTPVFSNWTLESIFRHDPAQTANTLFDWGTSIGSNSERSFISFSHRSIYQLCANLRDAHQTTTDKDWLPFLAAYTPDARWHHAAMVKDGTNLYTYLDYQLISVTNLSSAASGGYIFDTNSVARIGQTLNNGNTSIEQDFFDQVRFSRVALTPRQFLQPARPLILASPHSALDPEWQLTVKTIQGRKYQIETTGVLANIFWAPYYNFTATGPLSSIDVSITSARRFIRIREVP